MVPFVADVEKTKTQEAETDVDTPASAPGKCKLNMTRNKIDSCSFLTFAVAESLLKISVRKQNQACTPLIPCPAMILLITDVEKNAGSRNGPGHPRFRVPQL